MKVNRAGGDVDIQVYRWEECDGLCFAGKAGLVALFSLMGQN